MDLQVYYNLVYLYIIYLLLINQKGNIKIVLSLFKVLQKKNGAGIFVCVIPISLFSIHTTAPSISSATPKPHKAVWLA